MTTALRGFVVRQPTRLVWPLFVALSLAFVFSRGGQFGGFWLWTSDWTAGTLILTGPMFAAVAAWQAAFQMKHMREATVLAAGNRGVLAVLGSQALVAVTIQLVSVLAAVAWTVAKGAHPGDLTHFVPQFLVAVGYVAFGTLVGLAVRRPLIAPFLAVAAYLLALPQVGLLPRALVKFGGATANLVGLEPTGSFDVAHTAFGLGVAGLAVGVGRMIVTRRLPDPATATLTLAGATAAALAVAFFVTTTDERFTEQGELSLSCSRSQVDICLTADAESMRAPVTEVVSRVLDAERAIGVSDLPTRVVVSPSATTMAYAPNSSDRPMVLNGGDLGGSVEDQLMGVLPYLTIDRRCLQQAGDAHLATAIPALELASNELLLRLTPAPDVASIPDVRKLRETPEASRTAWLRSVFSAANRCALDEIPAHP